MTSVTQIAYRLGYSDVASFVRSFRGQTGRTPTSFREQERTPVGRRKGPA
jgi:AraC-like DNA-binding protein